MKNIDYETELQKIYDFEIEISSIADCRRIIDEISEQEAVLTQIKIDVNRDIRSVESQYVKKRTYIRNKYASDKSSGFLDSLRDSFSSNQDKEMEKLEDKRNENLEYFYEIKFTAENLLIQTEDIKENVEKLMNQMLRNHQK